MFIVQNRYIQKCMREYDIKRGHKPDLKNIMKEHFGNVETENARFCASYGAIKKISAYISKNKLYLSTEMNRNVDSKTASDTIKKYNKFLEATTGYTAKERIKKIKKHAGK